MRPDYIIIMGAFVAAVLNFVVLRRKAARKDLWISSAMLLFSAVFYLVLASDIPMPSFVDLMGYVFDPLAKPVVNWVTEGTGDHG